jgi:hypothetical protein
MSSVPYRVAPWKSTEPPAVIRRYIRAFEGEFDSDDLESSVPYRGSVREVFRRSTKVPAAGAFHRFNSLHWWPDYWAPKRDPILHTLTADLLWAAVCLGGRLCYEGSPAGPGGAHASGNDLWVALLDGGVGIEVLVYEHETTNRVSASQRTTIRGNAAFRAVTRSLGFDHLPRKLLGEHARPDFQSLDRDLAECLASTSRERQNDLEGRERKTP